MYQWNFHDCVMLYAILTKGKLFPWCLIKKRQCNTKSLCFIIREIKQSLFWKYVVLISIADNAENPITFNIYTGYRLDDCAIETITVHFRLNCFQACMNNQLCLSVNFKELSMNGFICQLNNGVRSSQNCALVEDNAYKLYEFSP